MGGKQSSDHPRTDQETENVDQDDIGAVRRNCSEHRRYSIGCDQETKSPSQWPTGSGHRSAHRPTFQSLQSRSHRRWYPWLQSNARALLNCLVNQAPSTHDPKGHSNVQREHGPGRASPQQADMVQRADHGVVGCIIKAAASRSSISRRNRSRSLKRIR